MKTHKTFTKRFKVSKHGKLKVRPTGQNHFNAKESRRGQLGKKGFNSFTMKKKTMSRFFV